MLRRRLAAIFIFPCLVAAEQPPSNPPTQTSTAPTETMREVNGIPLALLSSVYHHVKDSGWATTVPDRRAMLMFHPSGAAYLLFGTEETDDKAYEARFSYRHGLLSLRFRSGEFTRSASFPLDLAADQVTMPFQAFSAQTGTSTWQRAGSDDRLLDNVNALCVAIVRARRADSKTTTVLLAKYLESFVHPAGTPEVDVSPAPRIFSMTSFRLREGSLAVYLERPEGPERIWGTFAPCFDGVRRPASCASGKSLTCSAKGCRCWGQEDEEKKIGSGETTVTGSCDSERINEAIRMHFNEVRYECYEVVRTKGTSLAGKIAASFTIDSSGEVRQAKLAESTMNNNDLDQCILARIRHWRLPKHDGGGVCIINYTFLFNFGEEDE
jgi:hypothetical protein